MFYQTFSREEFKFTALSHEEKALTNLYNNLQITFWKLKHARDDNGNYLFLTWQNNWQIELEHRLKKGEKLSNAITELHHINAAKESLLQSSNTSFAHLYGKILYITQQMIRLSGGEAEDLSMSVLKTILFMPL